MQKALDAKIVVVTLTASGNLPVVVTDPVILFVKSSFIPVVTQ